MEKWHMCHFFIVKKIATKIFAMQDVRSHGENQDSLFHLLQQSGKSFEVPDIYLQVEQVAVAVEELVRGEAVDVEVVLYGALLVGWQVVVGYVGAADVVLFDDVLP